MTTNSVQIECSSNKAGDPVADWLNAHPEIKVPLTHETVFYMDRGMLIVRTNSDRIVRHAERQLSHYRLPGPRSSNLPTTAVEIFYVGDLSDSAGFPWEASWDAQEGAQQMVDSYTLFRLGSGMGLWRKDALAWFVPEGKPFVRMVVSDLSENMFAPPERGLRLKGKGLNADAIVDLIHTLYFWKHNLFCIHGAALMSGDNGVIVVGPSGSGKTTTALALLRGGFTLLSDEFTLVEDSRQGGITMHGLLVPPRIVGNAPASLDALEETLQADGEWKEKSELPLPRHAVEAGRGKSAPLKMVILLNGAKNTGPQHVLERLGGHDAFVVLMNQSLDSCGSARQQARFLLLAGAAESCPAYRLTLGRDLNALPELIAGAMENVR